MNLLKTSKSFIMVLAIFGIVFMAACQQNESSSKEAVAKNQDDIDQEQLSFTDSMEREVILEKRPEKIVVLSPEMLKMIYDLGGEAVGRMSTSAIPIPEEAQDLPELGTVNQINTEQLVALSPDLVIGSPNFHANLEGIMESSNIPFALLQMRSFDDVKEVALLIGEILDKEDIASQKIKEAEEEISNLQNKLPQDDHPSVVVLNVTAKSVSVQRANTTAIEIGDLLHVENIGKDMQANPDSQTSAPYSLETIVEKQPDYVLLTIHGSVDAGKEKIKEDLEANPAWNSLKAVQEGNVHIIPSEKYLSNPGFDYADTMKHMAEIVYPEVFHNE
ncbi:ABC transporter substrate-binding protein [Gracilibacillus dipsosauri]|uniref:ABC transporter substrate-binding protein n=1 Tax=Gracilibacillus dipsosauri TaxID=178340 RepID=UPI000D7064AE|nr:ABC transporter substrate-binding protein [Gracilibacillus dipsosauri]